MNILAGSDRSTTLLKFSHPTPIWARLARNGLSLKFNGGNVPGPDLPELLVGQFLVLEYKYKYKDKYLVAPGRQNVQKVE